MRLLNARRKNIKYQKHKTVFLLAPEAPSFWKSSNKKATACATINTCAVPTFNHLSFPLFCFFFFLSLFPPATPPGGPAELCWFQVLHREPHEEPRRPEPEAGPDLPALQQDHGETRTDLRQEYQRQWRWWGQVWYGRTPVHLTWHFRIAWLRQNEETLALAVILFFFPLVRGVFLRSHAWPWEQVVRLLATG